MLAVAIYIEDVDTLEYNRVDLFDDEKISVTSSIQNINDISKTFTDFSQTFTVPASKQNNKIFKHWYENSNDVAFSTLTKSNAYIEIDTIPFRKGKIQLESANIVDSQPQNYSITFIGILGNLKDIFAGLYLKDLSSTEYDYVYTPNSVYDRVASSGRSEIIMYPLISSSRIWNYQNATDPTNNINNINYPIRYNELFPAIKLEAVLDMIQTQFNINFYGTDTEQSTFLLDQKFSNAYLWLKNADVFTPAVIEENISYQTISTVTYDGCCGQNFFNDPPYNFDTHTISTNSLTFNNDPNYKRKISFSVFPSTAGINYTIYVYINNLLYTSKTFTSIVGNQFLYINQTCGESANQNIVFKIKTTSNLNITSSIGLSSEFYKTDVGTYSYAFQNITKYIPQTIQPTSVISVKTYMPEIKIEDFFSGLLKMFNLTCYSNDGINYTINTLDNYYSEGNTIDITKYVSSDDLNLNRVKTYNKINFEYNKSDSLINVAFNSTNGVEYGTLLLDTDSDGSDYSIKLPFEDLNFNNLKDKLQVGYSLKTDYKAYIPKPIILYDYNITDGTVLSGTNFYFSTVLTGGSSTSSITTYKPFGQETLAHNTTYGLNFPTQQSTLTNEIIENGLYQEYYQNYLNNIFNYKSRLIKIDTILPTSILTSIKLNNRLIIRDKKYIINTMNTDLTTGEVKFELLTDFRPNPIPLADGLVNIDGVIWTNKNLNVTTYRNGDAIPQVTDDTTWENLTTGAWCHYDNDPANDAIYGKLYNWYAVNDSRGLAPVGYHIPTSNEYNYLADSIGGFLVAGAKLKTTGTIEQGTGLWISPNIASNVTKFNAVPSGYRWDKSFYSEPDSFQQKGEIAYFWTTTDYFSGQAYARYLSNSSKVFFTTQRRKMWGISVRLIKD